MISFNQKEVPIEKLNGLVLSELFFSIGDAYDSDTNGRWRPLSSATLMEIAS